MSRRTATANRADPIQQQAAADGNGVQYTCNLVAVVGCFHRHPLTLLRSGVCGDELINHPVSLLFVSKPNSLCRMTSDRELVALGAIGKIENGKQIEYEVIPL